MSQEKGGFPAKGAHTDPLRVTLRSVHSLLFGRQAPRGGPWHLPLNHVTGIPAHC